MLLKGSIFCWQQARRGRNRACHQAFCSNTEALWRQEIESSIGLLSSPIIFGSGFLCSAAVQFITTSGGSICNTNWILNVLLHWIISLKMK